MIVICLVAAFVVAAAAILISGTALGRWIFALAAAPVLAAFITIATQVPAVLDGRILTVDWEWVPELSVSLGVRLDGFSTLLALLVTGIGLVVLVYAAGYFADASSPRQVQRFAAFFTLFAGAMLGLVIASDVWTLFVCWELTSVLSFLLIGLDDEQAAARTAALRAFLVTGAGGLVLLGGFLCLVHEAGSADFTAVVEAAPHSTLGQVGLLLVVIGAFSKSAQFPLHFWLPGAMAAPTPVSAYLHSATMVKAGVVLIARFAPAAAVLGWWRPLLVVIGGVTMLLGGVAALRRDDAKQSLAFGTVSQLGFLVVLVGIGDGDVGAAGVAWLLAHALFKCALFLTIGVVDHATGSRDLRRLSGVGRALPVLAAAAGLCTLSMIGLPPLVGFAAKEAALDALLEGHGVWFVVALVVVVLGSILTTAYSARLWWGLFATKRDTGDAVHVHHDVPWSTIGPVAFLAAVSVLAGLAAVPLAHRLDVAVGSLDESAHAHLTLWAGVHAPLGLSVLIVAAGVGLAVILWRRQLRPAGAPTLGERAYGRSYNGLLDGAGRLTTITQSGSLPGYIAIIMTVVVLVIGVALARDAGSADGAVLADSAMQVVVALIGIALSIAVVASRRRFVSVLLLGGVGQVLTVLFLMYGAPDLALTQFMIETMGIVAFVLVLRHLPREFSPPPSWAPRAVRIGIAAAAGVAVAWFALAAGSVDRPTDVRDTMEAQSLPAAGGRNVVNVAVIDFRGVDTMFEITVFGTAALGVANLVGAASSRVGRRRASRPARMGAQSMVFEQVTRMIFHLTLLVSVYVALRGHNAPGGGFAGGLIAGAAFVFRILAGGPHMERPWITRLSPTLLIAVGILMAAGSGLVAVIVGQQFLETAIVHIDLPWIGDVKLVSAAIFDFGVYLLVVGVVIIVLGNLASRTHAGGAEAT